MGIWGELIIATLAQPKVAARRILELRLSAETLVEAALAVTCLGMICAFLAVQFNPAALDASTAFVVNNPLFGAAFQLGVLALAVLIIFRFGQLFGGKGTAIGALAIAVWLDFMMVLIQVVQVMMLLLLPPLATLLTFVAVFWIMWAIACFVGELHGFENTIAVLGGVVLSMAMLFFSVAFVITILGAPMQGSGP
ncbi:MAG: YIP1 family protein [Pseudomonadota bacterium]